MNQPLAIVAQLGPGLANPVLIIVAGLLIVVVIGGLVLAACMLPVIFFSNRVSKAKGCTSLRPGSAAPGVPSQRRPVQFTSATRGLVIAAAVVVSGGVIALATAALLPGGFTGLILNLAHNQKLSDGELLLHNVLSGAIGLVLFAIGAVLLGIAGFLIPRPKTS